MRLAVSKNSDIMKSFDVSPPVPDVARKGLAIVAIAKNEADYIAEWLEFHSLAGTSRFIIYDNGSVDETIAVIKASPQASITSIIPWKLQGTDPLTKRRISQQIGAYAHAITTFGMHFQRMAFIDIDEYLVPQLGLSIMEAVASVGNPDILSLPWHMFGHNGHSTQPDGLVIHNYTKRAPMPFRRYKCIVDPCVVTGVSVHAFDLMNSKSEVSKLGWRLFSKKKRRHADLVKYQPIQLNHYYLRSKEELEKKLSRGPVNYGDGQKYRSRILSRVAGIEANPIEDTRAIEYYIDAEKRSNRG